jgi:hypothetical protein
MKPCWDARDVGIEDTENRKALKDIGFGDEELWAGTLTSGKDKEGVEGEKALKEGPVVTLERISFPRQTTGPFRQ